MELRGQGARIGSVAVGVERWKDTAQGWWKPVADQKENRKGRCSFHRGPMRGGGIWLRNRELEERFSGGEDPGLL